MQNKQIEKSIPFCVIYILGMLSKHIDLYVWIGKRRGEKRERSEPFFPLISFSIYIHPNIMCVYWDRYIKEVAIYFWL